MRIPLSPMDYYFYRKNLYTIQFVFEYKGQLNDKQFEKNLEKATHIYKATTSRLKIISNEEVVLQTGFPLSVRNCYLRSEPKISSLSIQEQFLEPVINDENEPLVKILVTHTPSKTFVGFSFSHMLGDGASFFNFLAGLSEISTEKKIEKIPSDQRHLLKVELSNHEKIDCLFDSTGYVFPSPEDPLRDNIETLRYSAIRLKELKSICQQQGKALVTSNDILMAELAKRFHKDIPLYGGNFIIRCPVDYRRIYGLPPCYFGNAVRDALTFFKPNEIETLELPEIAIRIRKSIQSVDRQSVTSSLRSLESLRIKKGIGIFENVGCPGLLVSNLSKIPIQEIDLGLGAPIGFHQASLFPRLALILPFGDGVEIKFKR